MRTKLINDKIVNSLATLPIGDKTNSGYKKTSPIRKWAYCSDGSCSGDCVGGCLGTPAGHRL